MFAIFKTGGKQYKAEEGKKLIVEKILEEEEKTFEFNDVLLVRNENETLVGTPLVSGAKIITKVLKQFKDTKVIVFKKKRRKGYKRKKGHRQKRTLLLVEKIQTKTTS